MKKILLYAIGCVVIVLCVVCYFAFTQTRELQECKNERDKISGCVEKAYYENGNLRYEIPYKNGEIHGVEKWYYENGNLRLEIPFENDKRHGIAKAYYENGIYKHK
ncbi:toxin-antitoxin system YwqK family antitoxin [uncultured Helicobacter sp.]|uniref:toxin-antitoxin system YwqK family antitoxin n=1 Tax=uncultured Helicobacter sp. TaxID=175537 RepID=UPI00374E553C